MSTVDVKSLFKSGKKTIKAFKVAGGPTSETNVKVDKSGEETLEHWEAPVVEQPASAVGVSMGMDDFKGQSEEAVVAAKTTVSWKEAAAVVEEKPKEVVSTSAYVPPSARRAEAVKAMPSLEEVAKMSQPAKASVPAAAPSVGAPSRLKLITSATKKAMEEEAKKKEDEKLRKEQEKLARKEELRAELERQASVATSHESAEPTASIQAGSLSEIYAKYVDRPKRGRKMVVVA